MQICADCPTRDPETGKDINPNLSRDQRPQAKDGRCYTCHDQRARDHAERRILKRQAREWKLPTPAHLVNWARI